MQFDMLINGKALVEYGGLLLRDYDVQDCSVDNIYYKGRNRTCFTWMAGTIGLKSIRLEIAFFGRNRHEVLLNKSRFANAIYGKTELFLPDGFFYTAVLDGVGSIEWIGDQGGIGTYDFQAQQHARYEETTARSVVCKSTIPYTDCALTLTVSTTGSNVTMQFAGASFLNCNNGDALAFDGINKLVQKNGQNYAASVTFQTFPQLTPGLNTFAISQQSSADTTSQLTIGYYPTYL